MVRKIEGERKKEIGEKRKRKEKKEKEKEKEKIER